MDTHTMHGSRMVFVLMGVSGSGKTTIGSALAELAGAAFADADDYHSAANKQKMAAGHALNDDDRQPWLETLNEVIRGWFAAGRSGVLACSALKQRYRETLSAGMPKGTIRFVLLEAPRELIAERLAERHHEYMNPSLLDSQFKTLEPPSEDDPTALTVVNDKTPAEVAEEILRQVGAGGRV